MQKFASFSFKGSKILPIFSPHLWTVFQIEKIFSESVNRLLNPLIHSPHHVQNFLDNLWTNPGIPGSILTRSKQLYPQICSTRTAFDKIITSINIIRFRLCPQAVDSGFLFPTCGKLLQIMLKLFCKKIFGGNVFVRFSKILGELQRRNALRI